LADLQVPFILKLLLPVTIFERFLMTSVLRIGGDGPTKPPTNPVKSKAKKKKQKK